MQHSFRKLSNEYKRVGAGTRALQALRLSPPLSVVLRMHPSTPVSYVSALVRTTDSAHDRRPSAVRQSTPRRPTKWRRWCKTSMSSR